MNSKIMIRVLLADDHLIVREGFKRLLSAERDIEIVGDAANGLQAVDLARKLRPDVILMDISMPRMNGLGAARLILKDFPGTKVIIFSTYSDAAYVESAADLGVSGYLLKQTAANVLPEAIREVHKGGTYCSPAVSKHFLARQKEALTKNTLAKTASARLSPREMDVLRLIAEGEAIKQIAESLSLGIKSVEKHRDSLLRKLKLDDSAGLTRYAIAEGVIDGGVQLTII